MKAIAIASKAAEALRSGEWDQVHSCLISASYFLCLLKSNSALLANRSVLYIINLCSLPVRKKFPVFGLILLCNGFTLN